MFLKNLFGALCNAVQYSRIAATNRLLKQIADRVFARSGSISESRQFYMRAVDTLSKLVQYFFILVQYATKAFQTLAISKSIYYEVLVDSVHSIVHTYCTIVNCTIAV